VSAIVFWPEGNQTMRATSFLLFCLAIIDNAMLLSYYLAIGVNKICAFCHACPYYMKVRRHC